jgi:hypothetical protein
MLRHALLFCLATVGCGGLTERDKRPEDWHPVGGPVELPLQTGEVRIVNDGIESVWQISAHAREWLRAPACSERMLAACSVRSCEEPLAGDPAKFRDLGFVDVTLGSTSWTVDGSASGKAPLWNGTQNGVVSSTGADVPPFQVALVAPPGVQLLLPEVPSLGNPHELNRSTPLEVRWSGGEPGRKVRAVLLWQAFTKDSVQSVAIACSYPATDGAGSIPSDLLLDIPSVGGVLSITLEVMSYELATVFAGDFEVTVSAVNHAQDENGSLAIIWLH